MKDIFLNVFAFHTITAQKNPFRPKDPTVRFIFYSGLFVALFSVQLQLFVTSKKFNFPVRD